MCVCVGHNILLKIMKIKKQNIIPKHFHFLVLRQKRNII